MLCEKTVFGEADVFKGLEARFAEPGGTFAVNPIAFH